MSWKKLFAEGIERFRREDLDGALKSFDEVLTFPSFLLPSEGATFFRILSGYPSCKWRVLCATRLACSRLRKAKSSQGRASRREEDHRHRTHPVAWLFSLRPPLRCPQQVFFGPAHVFTRTGTPRRGRQTRRTTARAHGSALPAGVADQVPDRGNAR